MSEASAGSAQQKAAEALLPGQPAMLAVGKLLHAHGVHGEMLMEIYTDFPERLVPGIVLYLEPPGASLCLVKRRTHHAGLLVTFEGYATPEAAAQLRNQLVYVQADDRPPLPEGEYYHHQLLGLRVMDEAGEPIGVLAEILETGATDVLIIRRATGGEVLIPMVDSFVRDIDLQKRTITVRLIPGMLSEET